MRKQDLQINEPLVSVIVASYRRYESLARALESIANQTYHNIETVVVDDNADVNWNAQVSEIIERVKETHPDFAIEYVRNSDNKGSALSRNIGIKTSKGEYITFLDDDDIYLPEKIERQCLFMEACQADYCITDLDLYFEDGSISEHRVRKYLENCNPDQLFKCHIMYHMTGTDTMMFRRDYLFEIGLFPLIDVGDEFYLMMKAIEGEGKFAYLNRCDVNAVVHSKTDGLSSGEQKIKGENALYKVKKDFFQKLNKRDIRYVKVRHHLVIAFAQFRRKYWLSMIKHGIIAVIVSPVYAVRVVKHRV